MPDAYYCWLVGLIGDGYIERNYQKLLWKLYSTDYFYELTYDRNRAADGLFLRKAYAQKTGKLASVKPSCTVLEMLVALARKAEDDIMYNPDLGDRTGRWFWVMLENLGLDIYDDYHFFEAEVNRILDVFLHHRYEKSGVGGAFQIRRRGLDLRKTDLWWQMNAYLEEHYPM